MDTVFRLLTKAMDRNGIDPENIDIHTKNSTVMAMSLRYCTVVPGNFIYIFCFLALLCGQLWFGIRNKTWTFMGTICAGILGEVVGYIGRVMFNINPFSMNNFLVNLVPLTLAPALLTAGIYLCVGRVIVAIGAERSRLSPKWYTYIFVGCDLLALVLQAIGGGMAATARNSAGSKQGVNIMIAGLISQVVTIVAFLSLWADFVLRTRRAKIAGRLSRLQPPLYEQVRSTTNFGLFQWSLFVATVLIFIRCAYRVAELWNGFSSHLANDEVTFMIFEGPLIILAVTAMTIFHPGRVFGNLWVPAGKGIRSGGKLADDEASAVHLTATEWSQTAYQRIEQPAIVV